MSGASFASSKGNGSGLRHLFAALPENGQGSRKPGLALCGDLIGEALGFVCCASHRRGSKKHMNGPLRLDGASIVLVEDDPQNRDSLVMLLESEGAQVVAVTDAEEGVEAALRVLPDAVVCDLDLPMMDGFYLIQRLREHEISTNRSPCVAVAITGHTDEAYRLRSIGEGFQHFMTKPAPPEVLIPLLREAISARAAS
jgi:CheY-like chemotaxis protein